MAFDFVFGFEFYLSSIRFRVHVRLCSSSFRFGFRFATFVRHTHNFAPDFRFIFEQILFIFVFITLILLVSLRLFAIPTQFLYFSNFVLSITQL